MRERRRLALWTPVCVGVGIWFYFLAPYEPAGWTNVLALTLPLFLLAYASRTRRILTGIIAIALLLAAIGLAVASLRARIVAAPVLAEAADLTVEGLVEEISRSRNGAARVLLDEVTIFGLSRNETPRRVRVTLLGGDHGREIRVGERISVYANLSPPAGAVEPGAFDFRQWAWFRSLGAVGFARGAVVSAAPRDSGSFRIAIWRDVQRLRFELSQAIQARIPGEAGAFSSAIITGDRAGVSEEALQALRDSNLAHLLAISGLHMGLLTALVFGLVRLAIALAPPLALRLPSKKVAAVIALAAASAYLVMSGASIATQRAFIMVAVALGAVLIDRPAITLRALAAAALIILLTRPESLIDAGFQMSFAATAALVAAFEELRRRKWLTPQASGWTRTVLIYLGALFVTSVIAGLATAPFAAAAFNRVSNYGLMANLLAVPAMGLWVMPSALAAGMLSLVGLEAPAMWSMGKGVEAILAVARWVAGMEGATRPVQAAPTYVMPLIVFGGLWLCIWTRKWRSAGAGLVGLGLLLWVAAPARPELLVSDRGQAIGLMHGGARAIDRAVGDAYTFTSWLERDGDAASQIEAAARPGLDRSRDGATGEMSNGWRVVLLRRRPTEERIAEVCRARTLVIAGGVDAAPAGGCAFYGARDFDRLGALSVEPAGDRILIRGAAKDAAGRFWGARAAD